MFAWDNNGENLSDSVGNIMCVYGDWLCRNAAGMREIGFCQGHTLLWEIAWLKKTTCQCLAVKNLGLQYILVGWLTCKNSAPLYQKGRCTFVGHCPWSIIVLWRS